MRINLLGGPGAGKSTTAAWLFSELKRRNHSIELVTEYVKNWVYLNRLPQGFDQIYLFGKQLHSEDKVLSAGVKNIVTDSPLFLGHIYARLYSGIEGIEVPLLQLAEMYDKQHPSVSIYLERKDKIFHQQGRWGTLQGAEKIDVEILRFVEHRHAFAAQTLLITDYNKKEEILEFVERHLTK